MQDSRLGLRDEKVVRVVGYIIFWIRYGTVVIYDGFVSFRFLVGKEGLEPEVF